jgi:hypothetical protein
VHQVEEAGFFSGFLKNFTTASTLESTSYISDHHGNVEVIAEVLSL